GEAGSDVREHSVERAGRRAVRKENAAQLDSGGVRLRARRPAGEAVRQRRGDRRRGQLLVRRRHQAGGGGAGEAGTVRAGGNGGYSGGMRNTPVTHCEARRPAYSSNVVSSSFAWRRCCRFVCSVLRAGASFSASILSPTSSVSSTAGSIDSSNPLLRGTTRLK